MKLRFLTFGVELAEVEQELEGVVAHLEVIGVSTFKRASFLGILTFMTHRHLTTQ
jgi:hypothetical protein